MKLKIFYCPTSDKYYEQVNNSFRILKQDIVLWASQYYDSLIIKRQPKKHQERFKKWLINNKIVNIEYETIKKSQKLNSIKK